MIAKYAGTCTDCGGAIVKGEQIHWARGRGASHLAARCEAVRAELDRRVDGAAWRASMQGDVAALDQAEATRERARDAAEAARARAASRPARGRYGRRSAFAGVTVLSSGAELYRNPRGRCEDAPCCGCCNY